MTSTEITRLPNDRATPSPAGRSLPIPGLALLAMFACWSAVVRAEPWLAPGDITERNDLQLLSDSGLLSGPTLSWPIGWSRVSAELAKLETDKLSSTQRAAVERLQSRAARAMRTGTVGLEASLTAGADPTELRTFEDTPREDGEARLSADWLGERFAAKLSATVVTDPADNQSVRPDGSYLAMSVGNWMISVGYLERWWGPGWEGSLIVSTNARPVPAIALDRNDPQPFDVAVLRWLGPWRLSTFVGQLEADRDFPHTLLFGLRAEIRPLPSLQIAATRTAQLCGDGRPCDAGTWWDMLIGHDNQTNTGQQPGNQLGGFDVRWSWPGAHIPLALYGQMIGEDQAGFLPSKYLGLFGLETWGALGGGSWRAHAEYADTTCAFYKSPPEYGCAYEHVIYTSGYRYRGRAIGDSIDGDGWSASLGLLYLDADGRRWDLLLRDVKLNREGASGHHSLAEGPTTVHDADFTHERALSSGNIIVSLGFSDVNTTSATTIHDGFRGSITWTRPIH